MSTATDQATWWRVAFVCCGRTDGFKDFDDWETADAFRESYCDAEGHDRAGIIARIHVSREDMTATPNPTEEP